MGFYLAMLNDFQNFVIDNLQCFIASEKKCALLSYLISNNNNKQVY